MRRFCSALLLSVAGCAALPAQTATPTPTPPPPQSARQALLEMFLGKGENDFTKHLPEVAHQALIHKGDSQETNLALRISTFGHQMVAQGEHVESFETGPNLLLIEQNGGRERYEVAVEQDSLIGEDDEIELSIHDYKDGQLQSLAVVPRLIFTLRQEKEIWRLTEVTVAAHIPLTDPDYLKGLRKDQNESNESAAQNRVTIMAAAETNYATRHPDRGYACSLGTLLTSESGATPGENGFVSDPAKAVKSGADIALRSPGATRLPRRSIRSLLCRSNRMRASKHFAPMSRERLSSLAREKAQFASAGESQ